MTARLLIRLRGIPSFKLRDFLKTRWTRIQCSLAIKIKSAELVVLYFFGMFSI